LKARDLDLDPMTLMYDHENTRQKQPQSSMKENILNLRVRRCEGAAYFFNGGKTGSKMMKAVIAK